MEKQKIMPKNIKGTYRRLKSYINIVLLAIFLALPWLRFSRPGTMPDQAILIDFSTLRVYFFNLVIAPTQMYYLMFVLIIAGCSLFLVTSLWGRIWCGFTCPHTVLVDLFRKVESLVLSTSIGFKGLQIHAIWLLMAFVFAFGAVSYLYDAPYLFGALIAFKLPFYAGLFFAVIMGCTYYFAGFFREKMCFNICPYGRFQSAMVDEWTSQVMYNLGRGEPRGSLKSSAAGDCIDCYQCVMVCPMGIDIRDGFQMECIGCGLCIDACDEVMYKVGRPPRLINFEPNVKLEGCMLNPTNNQNPSFLKRLLRLKNVIFMAVIIFAGAMLVQQANNSKALQYSITFDPASAVTTLAEGQKRLDMKLMLVNNNNKEHEIRFEVNVDDAEIKIGQDMDFVNIIMFMMQPYEEYAADMFIKLPASYVASDPFVITIIDLTKNKEYKTYIDINIVR